MEQNKIAKALHTIAIVVYIFSVIGAIFMYQEYSELFDEEFAITISVTSLLVSFISGTFILGFSEVIKLLHITAYKNNVIYTQENSIIKSDELPEI